MKSQSHFLNVEKQLLERMMQQHHDKHYGERLMQQLIEILSDHALRARRWKRAPWVQREALPEQSGGEITSYSRKRDVKALN